MTRACPHSATTHHRCARQMTRPVFLHCAISTSGQIHGEFLRLLYILAHRAPNGTLTTWGMPSPALMPSPGASLNTNGNIRPPLALRMQSPSPAALSSRTPLVRASGLTTLLWTHHAATGLYPRCALRPSVPAQSPPRCLPKSFLTLPAHRHNPHSLYLVYIWLVRLPFVDGV